MPGQGIEQYSLAGSTDPVLQRGNARYSAVFRAAQPIFGRLRVRNKEPQVPVQTLL